jgi:signal transduction histidine kinase
VVTTGGTAGGLSWLDRVFPPAGRALLLIDVGSAAAIAVIQLIGSRAANIDQTQAVPLDTVGYVLLLVGPIALLVRRRYPMTVLLIVLAATATYFSRGYGYGPVFLSLIVAFLTASTVGSRWRTYPLPAMGYAYFVWGGPAIFPAEPPSAIQAAGIAAWLLVLVALAEIIRQRRTARLARQERLAAAERSTAEERRRHASEERLEIARELHDVLAHSLSLIHVQSSVALELFDAHPEQARPALSTIKTTSREAIDEVHALLASLRSGGEGVQTTPAPRIADLDAVVDRARVAGVEVETQVRGVPVRVPNLIDVAATRIVQESLTNVARHAGGAPATVTVTYTAQRLLINVDNRFGTKTPPTLEESGPSDVGGGGNGIAGMRERARALGGTFSAGPRPDGGFRVRAEWPLPHEHEVTG